MAGKPTVPSREDAIRQINGRPDKVLISLVRSQTVDLYAAKVTGGLRDALEALRGRAPDRVKVAVDAIERKGGGYEVTLDLASGETLFVPDAESGGFARTLGGGLCNLSKDLEIILEVLCEREDRRPDIRYLTWADAAEDFPETTVPGRSRTSLVFKDAGFEKLILTERGPTYDREAVDLWRVEQDFYGGGDAFLFVGQEPVESPKFDYVLARKLKDKGLSVFWLVGGNQLKRFYTEYRGFLAIADVVSLNLAEAAQFFGFEPLKRRHKDATELRIMYAKEISRRVLEDGANHVVITDGAKGASLARKARGGRVEFVYSPLIQENSIEVDPGVREDTGCGDGFAASIAAFLLARGTPFKLNEAVNFAHYIAGIIYQRRRPNLTEKDKGFVEYAYAKAKASNAFVGKHETFDRNVCQIRPATVTPRGPRRNVLVLILGGDPSDPEQPEITGAGAAVERLAQMARTGDYPLAPLVKVVPRLTTNPKGRGKSSMRAVEPEEMDRAVEQNLLALEVGNIDGPGHRDGVLVEDLTGHDGVYVMRATLLETLEILSSEDFAEWFADVKFWHFAMENVDERLVWHARGFGVSRDQTLEIQRQAMRDYIIRAQGPQYRVGRARATAREDFEREMTDQLILRLDALLAGVFRAG
jgi:sugar/nucleoside kinase (ribokinase family)